MTRRCVRYVNLVMLVACKHCTSGTTGFRVIGFLLLLAVGWMFVTWLPTWILAKAKVRMQSNLDRTYSEGSRRVCIEI